MYIIAIAWLYIVLMMSITAKTIFGGLMTFLWYGILPCALFLWIFGTPQRKRNKLRKIAEQKFGQPDSTDSKPD